MTFDQPEVQGHPGFPQESVHELVSSLQAPFIPPDATNHVCDWKRKNVSRPLRMHQDSSQARHPVLRGILVEMMPQVWAQS